MKRLLVVGCALALVPLIWGATSATPFGGRIVVRSPMVLLQAIVASSRRAVARAASVEAATAGAIRPPQAAGPSGPGVIQFREPVLLGPVIPSLNSGNPGMGSVQSDALIPGRNGPSRPAAAPDGQTVEESASNPSSAPTAVFAAGPAEAREPAATAPLAPSVAGDRAPSENRSRSGGSGNETGGSGGSGNGGGSGGGGDGGSGGGGDGGSGGGNGGGDGAGGSGDGGVAGTVGGAVGGVGDTVGGVVGGGSDDDDDSGGGSDDGGNDGGNSGGGNDGGNGGGNGDGGGVGGAVGGVGDTVGGIVGGVIGGGK